MYHYLALNGIMYKVSKIHLSHESKLQRHLKRCLHYTQMYNNMVNVYINNQNGLDSQSRRVATKTRWRKYLKIHCVGRIAGTKPTQLAVTWRCISRYFVFYCTCQQGSWTSKQILLKIHYLLLCQSSKVVGTSGKGTKFGVGWHIKVKMLFLLISVDPVTYSVVWRNIRI